MAVMSGQNPLDIISVEKLIDQAGIREKGWSEVHKRAELPFETIQQLISTNKNRKPVEPKFRDIII